MRGEVRGMRDKSIRVGHGSWSRNVSLPPGYECYLDYPLNEDGRRIWRCCICDVRGVFDKGWRIHSSLILQDEGYGAAVCSDACAELFEAGEIPAVLEGK